METEIDSDVSASADSPDSGHAVAVRDTVPDAADIYRTEPPTES